MNASSLAHCVFCRDAIGSDGVSCSGCSVSVHTECAAELLRCPTLGCVGVFVGADGSQVPFPAALPDRGEQPPAPPAKETPEPLEAAAASSPTSTTRRPRPPWRAVAATALVGAAVLFGGWVSSAIKGPGEMRTLGGWFSGHGGTFDQIVGTFTGTHKRAFGNSSVRAFAWSSDGGRIASVDLDRELNVWSSDNGQILGTTQLPFAPLLGRPRWIAFCPDRPEVLIGVGEDLQILEHAESSRLDTVSLGVTGHPGAHLVAGWCGKQGAVRLAFGTKSGAIVATLSDLANPKRRVATIRDAWTTAAAFSPDGETLALAYEGALFSWRMSDSAPRRVGGVSVDYVYDMAFSADGRELAILDNGGVTFYDLETMAHRQRVRVTISPSLLALSPNGRDVAVASRRWVEILDRSGERPPVRYPGHDALVYALAFSPKGDLLGSCAKDQLVKIWEVPK